MLRSAIVICGLLGGLAIGGDADERYPAGYWQCGDVELAGFDTPPVMVDSLAVAFPEIAVRSRISGSVTVEVAVLADGTVCGARVIERADPLLERASLMAARESSYEPALHDGVRVAGIIKVGYEFDAEAVLSAREQARLGAIALRSTLMDLQPLLSESAADPEIVKEGSRTYTIYKYKDIRVIGDISVPHLLSALQATAVLMDKNEVLHQVTNLWAFPPRDPAHADWETDIAVSTCDGPRTDSRCRSGWRYSLRYDGQTFKFVQRQRWHN